MQIIRVTVLVACIYLPFFPAQAIVPGTLQEPQPGMWSAKAAYLWPGSLGIKDWPEGGRDLSVLSPDGKLRIVVKDTNLNVERTSDGSRLNKKEMFAVPLAEVLWAPDSSAFAITWSEGGYLGMWTVTLYTISDGDVTDSDPGTFALSDFKRYFGRKPMKPGSDCLDQYPNVVAVAWEDGSKKLLLAVEMPCHSGCEYMCKWLGYVVSTEDGKIIKRLKESETRAKWKKLLGPRLKGN